MAQYTTGTIDATLGSPVITGDGTAWVTAGIQAGDVLYIDNDPTPYVISSVDSETQITVNANQPLTVAGYDYSIVSDFTASRSYPLVSSGDINAADILSEALRRIDTDMETLLGAANGQIELGPGTYIKYESSGPYLDFYVNNTRVFRLP